MRPRASTGVLPIALALLAICRSTADAAPVEVEPGELVNRPDLVGREVAVDGRVEGTFGFHKGVGFDEFLLVGSPVVFKLPPSMATDRPPRAPAVRAKGFLTRDRGQLVVRVSALEIHPSDAERLSRAVASLPPKDFRDRAAWADWALGRATRYRDRELAETARALAGEAIRIEADILPDAPGRWLELAGEARAKQAPEPMPSALAHRAFRALLRDARGPDALEPLVEQIRAFFPEAVTPRTADLTMWETAYRDDPSAAYRQAGPDVRAALDRWLLADAIQKRLELRAEADPSQALALADEARTNLPDRPEVAARLQALGLEQTDVTTLRRSEVIERARIYREDLQQPEKARDLLRRWLDDQRLKRLGPQDAEGRIELAEQYVSLLGDRTLAAVLLRQAWQIAPSSEPTAAAFRRLGYRLVDDDWQAAIPSAKDSTTEAVADGSPPPERPSSDPLLGLTRREVLDTQGKPSRISRAATQGQIVEQWIYKGTRGSQYILFQQRSGQSQATVTSHHFLP